MSDINQDGGPAYPCREIIRDQMSSNPPSVVDHLGISLRDWFAGQALAARITDGEHFNEQRRMDGSNIRITKQDVAQICYKYADAMLEARKTEPQKPI